MESKYCIIITTYPTIEDAENTIDLLISDNLAACVQVSDINSYYKWEGEVNKNKEVLLYIKTKTSLFYKVEKLIKENHTYEIPEVIKVPIEEGNCDYLSWINKSVK